MVLKKIPSAFSIIVGPTANTEGVYFEGFYWKNAITGTGGFYPRTLEDLVKYYPLAIKIVEREIGDLDKAVSISLPTQTFVSDYKSGGKLIDRLKLDIKKETGKDIEVLPQGLIALEEIYAQGHLKKSGFTMVIDGGFNTVNVALVDEEDNVIYVKSYYDEFGIRNLLENFFAPLLSNRFPDITLNLQFLKRAFLKKHIDIELNRISIEEEVNLSIQGFIPYLFEAIKGDLRRLRLDFDQFAIIGGLSYYIPASSIETNKPFFIPEKEGEFYTVKGMNRATDLNSIDFGFGDIKILKK
ncbi:MAG TPA: hypothetical protein ENO30_05295 [Thermodesulfobium narugense]|nr:hypothetical protein [Thermodesulfobium narugense]